MDTAFYQGGPTTRFSSAAGRFDRRQRAMARGGALHNAQVLGRASGVCCERGWAARWAAGRRAGAHRTCGRYARRVWPAAPRRPPRAATDGARPTQPRMSAPRSRGAIRHPRRGAGGTARACPGAYGVRDRPTPASAAPLAGSLKRGAHRHATAP